MDTAARQLLFHGIIVLLIGLLAGFPYGRAILTKQSEEKIAGWRVAHAALAIGGIAMQVVALALGFLTVANGLQWVIAISHIVSGYAFSIALIGGPLTGNRGLGPKRSLMANVIYAGNLIGSITSLVGTLALLYAAYLNL